MPDIHYNLYGMVTVPEGSKLTETGTGIELPDGRVLKVWEAFEIHDGDDISDISHDELADMDIHYDGDMCRFEIEGEN